MAGTVAIKIHVTATTKVRRYKKINPVKIGLIFLWLMPGLKIF